jgi:tetratricopeptide (TPR) repeat protein
MEERLEVGDPAIALKAALDGCALDREYSLKWCEDFIRLTGSAEIADPYLSSYVEAFPDDKRALLLPVHIQIIEGDYAGGLQSLLNLQEAAGGEVLWLKLLLTVLDEGRVEGAFSREEFLQQALERFSAELSSDTTSIERCLEIAEILRNNEQVDDTRPFEKSPTKMQALDFLLAASTVDGRSVEIELRIIDMLTRLGEYDLATERAGKLMQANPTSSGVRTTLARLCCYKHDYSTALEHIQKGLAASPAQPSLLQLLAEHHQREGEHEEALKIYRELYRRYPEGPHFIRLLATCEYEIGYPKLARKRVKPLIRRGFSEKWLEDLRAALDKVESVPDQTLSICRVYNFGSDPESPSKVVEGVPLEAIHHLIPTSILNLPDAGFVLFAYGEPDLCISLVQNAVKQIPQHVAYARVFSSTAITGEVRSEGRTVVTPMAILLRSQFAELVSNIPAGKIEGKLSSVLNGVDVILGSAPVEEGSRGNAPVAAQGMGV